MTAPSAPLTAPTVAPPRAVAPVVDVRPLAATPAGTLALAMPDERGRRFVSAASGIVGAGSFAWVVSDEYGELARFGGPRSPGWLVPALVAQRGKPDLEAISRVAAPRVGAPGGVLLAIGSGSKPDRMRGLAVPLDATGRAATAPRTFDLRALYGAFDAQLPLQPNIEGLAVRQAADGVELLFFHRGKADGGVNTIFRVDGEAVLAAALSGSAVPASALRSSTTIDLGTLAGERLGFADARALPDGRVLFVASAEGSDANGDGEIRGSAVGELDPQLQLRMLRPLDGPARKVEGIELSRTLDPAAPADQVTLVTDPDDPQRPTEVLTARLS